MAEEFTNKPDSIAYWIRQALKADEKGEHHVIVDGLYDEAQSYAKQIRKRGSDFILKANQRIGKARLDKNI